MNSHLFNCCRLLCQVRPIFVSSYGNSPILSQTAILLWTLLCTARPHLCQRYLFSSYTLTNFGCWAALTPEAVGLLTTKPFLKRGWNTVLPITLWYSAQRERTKRETKNWKREQERISSMWSSALCWLIALLVLHDSYSQCELIDHPGILPKPVTH